MSALSSLHSMYALVYALLMVTIIVGLLGFALTVYTQFVGG
jgi:hypothetical protein